MREKFISLRKLKIAFILIKTVVPCIILRHLMNYNGIGSWTFTRIRRFLKIRNGISYTVLNICEYLLSFLLSTSVCMCMPLQCLFCMYPRTLQHCNRIMYPLFSNYSDQLCILIHHLHVY